MTVITSIPPSGGPVECRLTPEQARERLATYARLGRDALLSVEHTAVLRFRPEARAGVEELVAAESRCCAFLGYEVRESADAIVLTLTAPDGAEPMLAELLGYLRTLGSER